MSNHSSSKTSRAAALGGSLKSSLANENSALDQRFRAAEETIARTGGNLLSFPEGQARIPVPAAKQTEHVGSHGSGGLQTSIEVALDLVDDNPENSRDTYPEEEIAELAELVRQRGQLEPAHAMPHPDAPGRWILLSGHKRKRALSRAGARIIKIIPATFVSGIERYKLSLAYNTHSRETAYDNAQAWSKLLAAGHAKTYEELAEHIGVAKSQLSKTLAFHKLPEPVLAKVREHPRRFGPAAAQLLAQIAQHAEDSELMRLVDGVIAEQVTIRQLEAEAARATQPKARRKPKVNSRQYKIHDGEAAIGTLKDWDHGRVLLEVSLHDPKRRLALIDLLKKELGINQA